MISYRTLNTVSTKMIYETFMKVFADYQVKFTLSYEDFSKMLLKKGYNGSYSIGAFKQDKLIGFILNGLRTWNGKKTLYDLGTGVIADMQHCGITSEMFAQMKKIASSINIDQYLLEVIQSNDSALQLYLKKGFKIQRELKCFQIKKENYQVIKKYEVSHVDYLDLNELSCFWNYQPSWQNSNDSLIAVKEQFYYSVVYDKNKIVGYGVINKKSGDIGQLAVLPAYRKKGIGKSILSDLIQRTSGSVIQVLNIDDQDTQLFLKHQGFENFVDQYEMLYSFKE